MASRTVYQDMDAVPPPLNPPPPELPSGWAAKWDPGYSRFYYINIHTKTPQWELPTAPVISHPPTPEASPPPYESATAEQPSTNTKSSFLHPDTSARDRRPSSSGAGSSANLAPPRMEQRSHSHSGLGSKLGSKLGKLLRERSPGPTYTPPPSNYVGVAHPQAAYKPAAAIVQGYPAARPYYGYSQYPQPMYGGRRSHGGMGAGGMAAMGMGGGLLGGMLLGDAIGDHDRDIYQDGFQDGADFDSDGGGFDGGDFDGGDFGGGDF